MPAKPMMRPTVATLIALLALAFLIIAGGFWQSQGGRITESRWPL
jgi:hypothetical protein